MKRRSGIILVCQGCAGVYPACGFARWFSVGRKEVDVAQQETALLSNVYLCACEELPTLPRFRTHTYTPGSITVGKIHKKNARVVVVAVCGFGRSRCITNRHTRDNGTRDHDADDTNTDGTTDRRARDNGTRDHDADDTNTDGTTNRHTRDNGTRDHDADDTNTDGTTDRRARDNGTTDTGTRDTEAHEPPRRLQVHPNGVQW